MTWQLADFFTRESATAFLFAFAVGYFATRLYHLVKDRMEP